VSTPVEDSEGLGARWNSQRELIVLGLSGLEEISGGKAVEPPGLGRKLLIRRASEHSFRYFELGSDLVQCRKVGQQFQMVTVRIKTDFDDHRRRSEK
jgi:hypothetical protein